MNWLKGHVKDFCIFMSAVKFLPPNKKRFTYNIEMTHLIIDCIGCNLLYAFFSQKVLQTIFNN